MTDKGTPENPYKVLHVDRSAPAEIISVVYRHLAKTYHPDTAPAHLRAEYNERMKVINASYETLADVNKRRTVDLNFPNDTGDEELLTPSMAKWVIANTLFSVANEGGGRPLCYSEGIKHLREVVKETEGTQTALNALSLIADAYSEGLSDHKNAAGALIEIHNRVPVGLDRDELLLDIMDSFVKAEAWQNALLYCRKAIEESEFQHVNQAGKATKGDLLAKLGQYGDAVEAHRDVVKSYPGGTVAAYSQYRIARIEDSDLQKYLSAMREYRLVLQNYPSSEWAKDCQWRIDHIQRKHIEKKGWWES